MPILINFSKSDNIKITFSKMKDNNIKQDWITDEQWKAVPSVQWWENQKQGEIYIRQSKPVTVEEALAQMERLRNSKNWKEGA